MNTRYTKILIQKLVNYFQSNYGIKINEEKAEQYLDSLANLYSAMLEKKE